MYGIVIKNGIEKSIYNNKDRYQFLYLSLSNLQNGYQFTDYLASKPLT